MLRRSLLTLPLLFTPKTLFSQATKSTTEADSLFAAFFTCLKEWLALVNARSNTLTYHAKEPNLWKLTKNAWHTFEDYVDKYYKGTTNELASNK